MARKIEARALRRREEIEEGSRGAESSFAASSWVWLRFPSISTGCSSHGQSGRETLTEALAVNGGQKPGP